MTIKEFLAFCLLTLLLAACKKDELSQIADNFIGDWEWLSSTGGIVGTTHTPTSEGYNETIMFQKNGQYVHYRDSVEQQRCYYWVEKGASIFSTDEVFLLHLGTQDHTQVYSTYSIEFEGQNDVTLKEECNDCFNNKYRKKS